MDRTLYEASITAVRSQLQAQSPAFARLFEATLLDAAVAGRGNSFSYGLHWPIESDPYARCYVKANYPKERLENGENSATTMFVIEPPRTAYKGIERSLKLVYGIEEDGVLVPHAAFAQGAQVDLGEVDPNALWKPATRQNMAHTLGLFDIVA